MWLERESESRGRSSGGGVPAGFEGVEEPESEGWKMVRRGKGPVTRNSRRLVIESKFFLLRVEDCEGVKRGYIEERSKGFVAWVALGHESLSTFLGGLECCYSAKTERDWGVSWAEKRRRFRLERGYNKASAFLKLRVVDGTGKRYCIFVPRGSYGNGGWAAMAELLRQLGIKPKKGQKEDSVRSGPSKA